MPVHVDESGDDVVGRHPKALPPAASTGKVAVAGELDHRVVEPRVAAVVVDPRGGDGDVVAAEAAKRHGRRVLKVGAGRDVRQGQPIRPVMHTVRGGQCRRRTDHRRGAPIAATDWHVRHGAPRVESVVAAHNPVVLADYPGLDVRPVLVRGACDGRERRGLPVVFLAAQPLQEPVWMGFDGVLVTVAQDHRTQGVGELGICHLGDEVELVAVGRCHPRIRAAVYKPRRPDVLQPITGECRWRVNDVSHCRSFRRLTCVPDHSTY
jgi:hypothetical protein